MADTEKATVPCEEPESSEASATATREEDSDSNFGAFSAYETAESSDIKSKSSSDDDSPSDTNTLEENAANIAPVMMSSSSLNENDFFDATSEEAAGDADVLDETLEETAVAENWPPETDIFDSVDDTIAATTIPDGLTSAVESKGVIIENITDDSTDPFAAFDAITDNSFEGGGEQTQKESSIVNSIQDSNIETAGIGEFEGTGSNVNDKILAANHNGPVADGNNPISMDELLENGENTHTESGENPTEALSTGTPGPDFTDNAASALDNNAPSEMNNTDKANDAFSAFDAFAEIQDAPPPSLGGTALSANEAISMEGDTFSHDEPDGQQKEAVTETTAVNTKDDTGQFTAATPLENAPDGNKDNGDNVAFKSSDEADKVDTEEGEAIPSSEDDVVQVPESNITHDTITPLEQPTEAANENPIIQDEDLSAKDDDGDDGFGSFEETIPIQAPQETLAAVKPTETNDGIEGSPSLMNNASDSPDPVDNFGLASFETPIERTATNDNNEKDESIAEVDESDDFGNFSEGEIEKDTHVEAAVEGTNAFGDFAASTEENTVSAMKEGVAVAEETMADGEFSDFGGYPAPPPLEKTPVDQETLEEKDSALAEKEATFVNATIGSSKDFGTFSAYQEENLTDEVDVALTEKDEVPTEQAASVSDDFGDFSSPEEKEVDTDEVDVALTEKDEVPIEQTANVSDDFGDFSAPEEVDTALAETDIALTETDTALAETEVALIDETIEEPSFGDFDGFSAPPVEEADLVEVEEDLPIETDTALTEKDITSTKEIIEDSDDFGNFAAPTGEIQSAEVETTETAETAGADDGFAEEDGAPAEIRPQESDDFGDFSTSAPSHVDASSNFADVPTPVEAAVDESDGFGDFGGFSSPAVQDGPPIEAPKGEGEESFGDFGDFAATASFPEAAVDNDSEQVDTIDNSEQDFGDFGDFSTPVETETTKTEPVVEEPAVEDDDGFGDFGDFEAFEEATPAETTPDMQQSTPDETKVTEDEVPNPQVQSSQAVSEADEFGDFGDFEESDATQEPAGKSEPSEPVVVLNENVRDIFQNAFQIDQTIDTVKRDSCIRLPFDMPMHTVLVSTTIEHTFELLHVH